MLKGGVIMDVVTPGAGEDRRGRGCHRGDGARACARRHPRRRRCVAHESDPEMIEGIQAAVTIPVMAKARIGHFVEAQILQALGVDYVDESEVLSRPPTRSPPHRQARLHGSVRVRRHEPGRGPPAHQRRCVHDPLEGRGRHRRRHPGRASPALDHRRHQARSPRPTDAELFDWAKKLQAPLPLVEEIAETGWLQVPLFCAGGLATPADAALAMQLGAEAVFVGSGIFKSEPTRHLAPRRSSRPPRTYEDADDPGQGQPWSRCSDDRHRHGRPRRPVRRPRLVAGPPPNVNVGVLALQGRVSVGTRTAIAVVWGPPPVEVRRTERDLDLGRASDHARRRVDNDVDDAAQRTSSFEPLQQAPRRGHAGVRHLRGDDPARDGDPRRPRRPGTAGCHRPLGPSGTPSGARSTASRPMLPRFRGSTRRCTRCSSGPRW